MSTDVADPIALLAGVYHPVRIGMWLDVITHKPRWSVDIEAKIARTTITGDGNTLEEALQRAVHNLTVYIEGE
jgi:hypothetical protein